MANTLVEDVTKTYTAFSGSDITAAFNGRVFAELQAITYSISREKSPIYTLGSSEPRSFARNKRGIAGTLIFTIFNRDALLEEMQKTTNSTSGHTIQKFKSNTGTGVLSVDEWDSQMSDYATGGSSTGDNTVGNMNNLVTATQAKYADELLPFDISITFANEYGQKAGMTIYGVELLNEGAGFSIDATTSERAYTFVARRIEAMHAITDDASGSISATF